MTCLEIAPQQPAHAYEALPYTQRLHTIIAPLHSTEWVVTPDHDELASLHCFEQYHLCVASPVAAAARTRGMMAEETT